MASLGPPRGDPVAICYRYSEHWAWFPTLHNIFTSPEGNKGGDPSPTLCSLLIEQKGLRRCGNRCRDPTKANPVRRAPAKEQDLVATGLFPRDKKAPQRRRDNLSPGSGPASLPSYPKGTGTFSTRRSGMLFPSVFRHTATPSERKHVRTPTSWHQAKGRLTPAQRLLAGKPSPHSGHPTNNHERSGTISSYCNPDLLQRRLHLGQRQKASAPLPWYPSTRLCFSLEQKPESRLPPPRRRSGDDGQYSTLERHPFSELVTSAGELLHTPQRVSTFMTTVPL